MPAGGTRNLVRRTASSAMSSSFGVAARLGDLDGGEPAVARDHELDPHRAEPARALGLGLGSAPAPRSARIRARRRGSRLPARWLSRRWRYRCALRRRPPPGRRSPASSGAALPAAPRGWLRPRGPALPWASPSAPPVAPSSPRAAPRQPRRRSRGHRRCSRPRPRRRQRRLRPLQLAQFEHVGADHRHADGIDLLAAAARHDVIGLTRQGIEDGRMRHQRQASATAHTRRSARRIAGGHGSRCTGANSAGAAAPCRRPRHGLWSMSGWRNLSRVLRLCCSARSPRDGRWDCYTVT